MTADEAAWALTLVIGAAVMTAMMVLAWPSVVALFTRDWSLLP